MNFIVILILLFTPASVKADDHVNRGLCDEIVSILREYRLYTSLTPSQVQRIAGNCYDEVDQIDEES